MRILALTCIGLSIFLVGCGSSNQSSVASFISKETQLQTRQYQVKAYKSDKETLMKVAISTLQDDNYIIEHSDTKLGVITATKKEDKDISKVSINVQEVDKINSKLRLNIELSRENFLGSTQTTDINKVYYYYIFDRIAKSLFLEQTLSSKSEDKKATIVIKKENVIIDNSIQSVVPKTMVITKPMPTSVQPQINVQQMPTNQVQQNTIPQPMQNVTNNQPQDIKDEKRVVTRGNNDMILRQSTNVVEEAPQYNYELAPNPNAPVQYYYNPQTNQYEYYGY